MSGRFFYAHSQVEALRGKEKQRLEGALALSWGPWLRLG